MAINGHEHEHEYERQHAINSYNYYIFYSF